MRHDRRVSLPAGMTGRALSRADAEAVLTVVNAAEKQDIGQVMAELEDLLGDWQRPSFDLSRQAIGVFEGESLVAFGEVFKAHAEAAVEPEHRSRGIGTWLADWLEWCARRHGGTVVGQTVPADSSPERFFRARGYVEGWTAWVLQVPAGQAIEPQPLPAGYVLRDLVPGEDDLIAYRLVEDAFNEWPDREPAAFDDWAARTIRRPGFQPWQMRFVADPTGEPVGVAFTVLTGDTGYVHQLAVRSDQRGRGLARALLVDAFGRARERGALVSELSTDSHTGALTVYEHIGMTITQTWRHWQTDL
jgi:GNAT superfamily N-acetyltransferase